jgi:hypothetical protein
MPVPQQEAVIVASLTLLRDHSDLLRDPGARQAQLRQIENAYGLIQECTDAAGHLHLDGASAATVFSLPADCMSRLRRATEDKPTLARVRARLIDWTDTLERLRDRAITRAIYRGPSDQTPRPPKSNGWNPPDPRE